MPWIGWGPFLPPDSTGDAAGSTATNCTEGCVPDDLGNPVMVPPVPTPATKMSIFPVGVAPDLLRGGFAVDRRIGRVLELLGHEVPLVGLGQFLALAIAPGMPSAPGSG